MLAVLVTPTFTKALKKLHAKDKLIVDKAVKIIASTPSVGEEKKGDLTGVFVYKFKIDKQEILWAYQQHPDKFSPESVQLLSLGAQENFYTELKRLN